MIEAIAATAYAAFVMFAPVAVFALFWFGFTMTLLAEAGDSGDATDDD